MIATDRELIKYILDIPEESDTLEMKRIDGEGIIKKILNSIVAMTNTDGGRIIIGVDDPEKSGLKGHARIFGIEENKDNYDALLREIQRIIPPLIVKDPLLVMDKVSGKTIAIISIPKATDQFRSINNDVFIRGKKSNIRLTPAEMIKLSYAKGFEKADKELVDVDFDLLNTDYYTMWKQSRNIEYSTIQDTLFHTGLARKDHGMLKPTRAAVLLFALHPTNIMETKCAIRVFQYAGNIETIGETPNLIGIPKTIEGPIIKQIKDAHDYVLTLLRSGISIPSGFTTTYSIPERAIKEAITNAVIHRDYYLKRDIEIRIFEDRVEFESPGLLPYNITTKNIGYVRSDGYRNDLLVKHLREFPTPPNLDQNEGVRAIRKEMQAQNLYPPIYFSYPHLSDSVRVVLLNETPPSDWDKISEYLTKNLYIDNEIARSVTGTTQVHKMSEKLKIWTKKGLLTRIPEDPNVKKGVKYKLGIGSDVQEKSGALFTMD